MSPATTPHDATPQLPPGRVSLIDGLPPHIAARIGPEWRANEADYWAARDALMAEYVGKWIGFAGGEVVASGVRHTEVFHAALATGRHPFFTRCGFEDVPARIRRVAFPYDAGYHTGPLPVVTAEFATPGAPSGLTFSGMIADTGADVCALPWVDCEALGLDPNDGVARPLGGVGGLSIMTVSFSLRVRIAGGDYGATVYADFDSPERILGRDVLNQLVVTFDGPAGQVIVNP